MIEHLLSTVVGRTLATDMLCVLGVLCVCVLVGCALAVPFLRLVVTPVARTWRRMTPFARIAIVPVIALAANFAASKQGGTNAPPQGASSPNGNVELRMEDEELRSLPVAEQVITNLCFTSISTSTNSVVLSLAWPTNLFATGTCLDFFAKAWSLTNRWEWIGAADVQPPATNLEVEVLYSQFAPSATNMPFAAFFRVSDRASCATSMSDSDGDGIPDVYELHNGTNPYVPDYALVPKLTVGAGGDYQTVAAALAASTNYSIVTLAAGEHVLSDSLVMPSHPVMLTGPENGYAVLRSSADIAVVMLDEGQNAETLFRNIYLLMGKRGNFQAGFWVGGNLPWSGVGASPTFANVRVRAMYPSTLYYGWHYYRDDGGASLVSNCVMNAAGATDVVGVYSYGGPDVVVADCHFVNFPEANGCYATYFQRGTNVVAEWAAPEPGLSWAGYPTNCCYSTTADSDFDGISDYDEIFTYDTDPWLADSDGDGIADCQEIQDGTDPRVFGSFLRHVTVIVTADDSLTSVTNYVAWGVAAQGWESNDVAAFACSPATNEFIIANSNATAYAKAYRDMNRNGAYDADADMLLSQSIPASAAPTIRFAFGDVDGDGVSDVQERMDGTNPYDAGSFRLVVSVVFANSDGAASATNYCACGMDAAWTNNGAVAFSGTASASVDIVVTNGFAYAKCLRDFDADGGHYGEGDVLYVRTLTKADNGKTVTVAIGDFDGDKVSDGMEVAHGTDPRNAKNYCFNLTLVETGIIRTTNDLAVAVMFGNQPVFGPALTTNGMFNADIGHLVATNGEGVTVKLWDDSNANGIQDAWEYVVSHSVAVNGHANFVNSTLSASLFDRDGDGIPDWWELAHADLGLSPDVAADSRFDPDGDGLINLHEYWAGTDMLVPDGSNTLLSVCARSVDDGIRDVVPSNAVSRFADYFVNGSNGVFVANTNFWARNLDLSCVSVWNSSGNPETKTATAITRRHIVMANHWHIGDGGTYTFCDTNGAVIVRTVTTSRLIAGDLLLGRLNEPLPDTIKLPKVLPAGYADYIGNGRYLPALCINQEKAATVLEVANLNCEATDNHGAHYSNYASTLSDNYISVARHNIRAATLGGNSGSPVFLVAGDELIFLFSKHLGSRDEPTWCYFYGPMITPHISTIQNRIDAWEGGDANLYQVQMFDVSVFDELVNQ